MENSLKYAPLPYLLDKLHTATQEEDTGLIKEVCKEIIENFKKNTIVEPISKCFFAAIDLFQVVGFIGLEKAIKNAFTQLKTVKSNSGLRDKKIEFLLTLFCQPGLMPVYTNFLKKIITEEYSRPLYVSYAMAYESLCKSGLPDDSFFESSQALRAGYEILCYLEKEPQVSIDEIQTTVTGIFKKYNQSVTFFFVKQAHEDMLKFKAA